MYSAADVNISDMTSPQVCLDPGYLQELPPMVNWREELRNDDLVVAGRALGRMVMHGFTAAKNKLHELTRPKRQQSAPRHTGTLALETTITAKGRHRVNSSNSQLSPGFVPIQVPAWSTVRATEYPVVAKSMPVVGSGYSARHAASPDIKLVYIGAPQDASLLETV